MEQIKLNKEWREKLLQRFLTYVKIYSTSDPENEEIPSSPQQWDIAKYLFEEMKAIGLEDVSIDENAYVYGFIPSNIEKKVPTVGFIAHFDTSPDFNGKDVNPQIWENYDGGDLLLNPKTGFTLSPNKFENLKQYKGQTLITTDGTSLLGADDKAGVAEIMTAAEYLIQHPEIKHGRIAVGFNPDEEIGKGAHKFNVEKFGAEWAYTMDGGDLGQLEYENFNAAGAKIYIKGLSVHTGYAKGRMVNASRLAIEFNQMLPQDEIPETTEGYEGFYHLLGIESRCEEAKLSYIIRDHDRDKFEERKRIMEKCVKAMNEKYGEGTVKIKMNDQYYNMKEKIDPNFHVIDLVVKAMQEAEVTPLVQPIRGGTDGAQLSFKGLPCPNIFAGGVNFHGPYEFVSIQVMEKAMQVIINISRLTAGYND